MSRMLVMRSGLFVLLLVYWCTTALAQSRLHIDIEKETAGDFLFPIAISKLLGEVAEPTLGQEIRGVLRQDLELTGLFRVMEAMNSEVPQAADVLSYEHWSAVGAAAVIAGQMASAPGGGPLALRMVLHDIAARQIMDDREYSGSRNQRREMAHRFSNHVFQAFTGIEGPFDTRVLCVAPRRAGEKGKDIVLMDYDGYGPQRLVADGALNIAPLLSPDGNLLAYTSYRSGTPIIYLRNLKTAQEERITPGTGLALPGSWSSNNRYLALNQTVEGNSDIYLYDTQTKRFTRLTSDWGIDVSPSFSPDGSQIVFTSDRGGSPQLYIMLAQSNGEARRLTFSGRYNTAPAWSPRGGRIAYVGTDTDGSLAVYTIGIDGQQLRRLASGGRNYESPTWAPNGRFMMYTSKHGDVWQRYMMREDGQAKLIPSGSGPSCFVSQWLQRIGPQ